MEILNRKARYDYEIEDEYEAGIVLTGTEIKSIRLGKANIKDSYAIIKNNEAYLLNTHISEYSEGNRFNHEETRTRKLLLHKKEIYKLRDKLEIEGYTLVPLKIYFVKVINCIRLQLVWNANKLEEHLDVLSRKILTAIVFRYQFVKMSDDVSILVHFRFIISKQELFCFGEITTFFFVKYLFDDELLNFCLGVIMKSHRRPCLIVFVFISTGNSRIVFF